MAMLAAAALLAGAGPARAQRDVGDPLDHFLATDAPGRTKRTVEEGVARVIGDFNNDGRADVALWQDPDFGPYGGPVFLYLGRRDGRFAAAGRIVVSATSLFKPVPVARGSSQLVVCEPRGNGEGVASGYSLEGFIVADLPRDALPRECPKLEAFAVERLDIERYRANGVQAWIRRREP